MKFNGKDQCELIIVEVEDGFKLIAKDVCREQTDLHNNVIEITKNELMSLCTNIIPLVERLQGKYSTLQQSYKAFRGAKE